MTYVADLHLHSSYAMATAKGITLDTLAAGGRRKGIDLLTTGDFTHPAWLAHLRDRLTPGADGLYSLGERGSRGPRFVLGTELSCVYQQGGRSHRIHLLVLAPDFQAVERLSATLADHGSLASDGRPILRLSGRDAVEAALHADARCEVIPAHVWTPWYAVLGSRGGFDSLAECFGDMAPYIHAVETGLSSDPAMNWRVPELENRTILSFSDAHSPSKLGREVTIFEGELAYDGLRRAIADGDVSMTLEFPPAEGKYHYDGHRKCGISQHPAVSMERGSACPVCDRPLTLGVLNRVESLSARPSTALFELGVWSDPAGARPPFRWVVPLDQVIGGALGLGTTAKRVRAAAEALVDGFGPELAVLLQASIDEITSAAGERIADALHRMREGRMTVVPGYDGVYGEVDLWDDASS